MLTTTYGRPRLQRRSTFTKAHDSQCRLPQKLKSRVNQVGERVRAAEATAMDLAVGTQYSRGVPMAARRSVQVGWWLLSIAVPVAVVVFVPDALTPYLVVASVVLLVGVAYRMRRQQQACALFRKPGLFSGADIRTGGPLPVLRWG
jgi:hypothetical protein